MNIGISLREKIIFFLGVGGGGVLERRTLILTHEVGINRGTGGHLNQNTYCTKDNWNLVTTK